MLIKKLDVLFVYKLMVLLMLIGKQTILLDLVFRGKTLLYFLSGPFEW